MSDRSRHIFAESTLNVYTAEYICGNNWWLDDTGRNWWSRKDFFPHCAIYLTKVGRFDLKINDVLYHVPSHKVVFIPAGSQLEFLFDGNGPLEKYFVHFDLNYNSGSLADCFDIPKLFEPIDENRIEALFNELIRYTHNKPTPTSAVCANAVMMGLVAELLTQTEAKPLHGHNTLPKEMLDTVKRMEERYCAQISITNLAKKAGYSISYFTKKFKSAFGCTPTEYIANLRVERAKSLLKAGELSIAQIAATLGFCETSHFSNFFKSKTGLSPAYYRHISTSDKKSTIEI